MVWTQGRRHGVVPFRGRGCQSITTISRLLGCIQIIDIRLLWHIHLICCENKNGKYRGANFHVVSAGGRKTQTVNTEEATTETRDTIMTTPHFLHFLFFDGILQVR